MAAVKSKSPALSPNDRRQLEEMLLQFDQSWDEGQLAARVRELPAAAHPLRRAALVELVKLDLEHQWQRERRVKVEAYLKAYPELGKRAAVPADLLLAEWQVRRQFGAPAELADFERRFPEKVAELGRLLERGADSVYPSQQIRFSRVTNGGRPSTVSKSGSPEACLPLPEHFGRYHILRRLGQGGMGAVYQAQDTKLDRLVALKVPHFAPEDGPEALQLFQGEAQTAATLQHPNICPIFDVGVIDGIHYLTMAYIDGRPLSEFIRPEKPLPARHVAAVVRKLALAMQKAHESGVVHRDLKPANVMVNGQKEPIITDFGLARRDRAVDARLTRYGTQLGTPAYMAPEQVRGDVRAVGPRSDIYSLGVTMYEMLTGRLPFEGSAREVLAKVASEAPVSPSTHRPDLDRALEAICLKAMARKPDDRHETMADFAAVLTAYLQPGRSGDEKPGEKDRPGKRRATVRRGVPRWLWIALGGAAALVLLGVVIWTCVQHGSETPNPVAQGKSETTPGQTAPEPTKGTAPSTERAAPDNRPDEKGDSSTGQPSRTQDTSKAKPANPPTDPPKKEESKKEKPAKTEEKPSDVVSPAVKVLLKRLDDGDEKVRVYDPAIHELRLGHVLILLRTRHSSADGSQELLRGWSGDGNLEPFRKYLFTFLLANELRDLGRDGAGETGLRPLEQSFPVNPKACSPAGRCRPQFQKIRLPHVHIMALRTPHQGGESPHETDARSIVSPRWPTLFPPAAGSAPDDSEELLRRRSGQRCLEPFPQHRFAILPADEVHDFGRDGAGEASLHRIQYVLPRTQ
ncbi:MAG TPA: serine/threonine-protein kinase [Gemmataceae bacterium]|nr:serine/threonine-protein kinase [Gemmataceae bacterium]